MQVKDFSPSSDLKQMVLSSKRKTASQDYDSHSSPTTMFAKDEALKILPTLSEILRAASHFKVNLITTSFLSNPYEIQRRNMT